jgi:Skp family chaperone for outer membrane proteins
MGAEMKYFWIVFAAVAGMTFAARAVPSPVTPVPKILIADRAALFEQSRAGEDAMRQAKAYSDATRKDFAARDAALQAEGQALQQQVAILSSDAKAQKIAAFEAKQRALQNLVQQKQAMMQGGIMRVQSQLAQQYEPILRGIMEQRGANLLLDKNAVLLSNGTFDITADAINEINKKIASIKGDFNAPTNGTILGSRVIGSSP